MSAAWLSQLENVADQSGPANNSLLLLFTSIQRYSPADISLSIDLTDYGFPNVTSSYEVSQLSLDGTVSTVMRLVNSKLNMEFHLNARSVLLFQVSPEPTLAN
jgi:hypothetical protein